MDRTLRLIQHNWVVLAYNLNVVILVLIIGESSIGAISAYHLIIVLSLLLPCIIISFLHLLSTDHKCTPPCYFPLLLKPAAQKEKMDWNSLTKSHVVPHSRKAETKPPYMCPGCSNHRYNNNMINKCHVQ
jgi:hypothetical protein